MAKYRIWFSQINQTYLDITAKSKEEAYEKSRRKWRKEFADPIIVNIAGLDKDDKE